MRRSAREVALRALFQVDLVNTPPENALASSLNENLSDESLEFARGLLKGTLLHLSELDSRLSALSRDWDVRRMPTIDRNILRMGAYEILFRNDVPNEVAINEAVELAKKYGEAKSPSFVNGVLGSLHRWTEP